MLLNFPHFFSLFQVYLKSFYKYIHLSGAARMRMQRGNVGPVGDRDRPMTDTGHHSWWGGQQTADSRQQTAVTAVSERVQVTDRVFQVFAFLHF